MLKVFVTSWKSYATHGSTMGRWMTLPMDSDQFENFLESLRTSLNEEEPEWAILDFEWTCGYDFGKIDERESLENLNVMLDELEWYSDEDKKVVEAILEVDTSCLENAMSMKDDYFLWEGLTLEQVAEILIKDSYGAADVPAVFWNYFDYEAYAESELQYSGYEVVNRGVLEIR